MLRYTGPLFIIVLLLGIGGVVGWRLWERSNDTSETQNGGATDPIAVEVAPVERGRMREVRVFSGTLESSARFVVASKVGGRIDRLSVDFGDEVARNQVVAELDDDEFIQSVAQAEAELAVSQASRDEAASALALAEREFQRARTLQDRGIASESQLDETEAALESRRAGLALAEAEVQRAEAQLQLARIRLDYTRVRATWSGGDDIRVVGERYQDAGNNVQTGDPILSVVELSPLTGVITVTERDYAAIRPGQPATLRAEAFPDRTFDASVIRVSPVFRAASRQARIELDVPNDTGLLKPGMFIRVQIVLREADAEAIVPVAALTRRAEGTYLFLVDEDGETVRQVPVRAGITEGDRVQVLADGADIVADRRVVVLGQQLLEDGSAVRIVEEGIAESARDPARGGE